MKRRTFFFAALLLLALSARPSELAVARRALGDGLDAIALNHAVAAEAAATNAADRTMARLVQLEALARARNAHDVLARLDRWTDATDETFRYWRAWALVQEGQTAAAHEVLKTPFRNPSNLARARLLTARLAAQAGDRAAAESAFRQTAEVLKDDPVARTENAVEWARALIALKDLPAALDVLRHARALDVPGPIGDEARLLAADLAARVGDTAGATALWRQILAGGTNVSEAAAVGAACSLFESLWTSGATNDALTVIAGAVHRAARPKLVRRAGFMQGFAQLALPALRETGRTNIVALIRKYPGTQDARAAHRRLADCLLNLGEARAAVKEYGILLESYPDLARDPEVLEARGAACLQAGLRVEAAGAFARAAQFATTNAVVRARCHFRQGDALMADGRYEEAAAAYARVDDAALASRARYQKGDALVRAGRAEDAAADFQAVLDAGGPYALKAGLRLAAHMAAIGRPENAIALYTRLLGEKSRGDDADLLDGREPSSAPAASPAAETAARAPEMRAAVRLGRGRAYYMAYRWQEAEADFMEVARLRPARANEMKFLSALCRYGAGQDAEAVAAVRELLTTTPDSPLRADLMLWLAKYEVAHQDAAAALQGFEMCATNRFLPKARQLEALERAAGCARAIHDYPKALELLKTFMQNPDVAAAETKHTALTPLLAEALLLQGEVLTELGRFSEASLVLDRAVRLPLGEDLHRRALIARADCLFAMGGDDDARYRQALEAYRAVVADERLSPSKRLVLAHKIGLALDKLAKNLDEMSAAADQYYSNVVLAYEDGVRKHLWFDEDATSRYVRAVNKLADYYERKGATAQAIRVLGHLAESHLPAAEVARGRIERLKGKGGLQ